MKIVTMYEADDGEQFYTEELCLEYEQRCIDLTAANDMLANGATLMASLARANQTQPWWDSKLSLEDKVILTNTTKDTEFVVSHWQRSDKPAYKPCRLDHNSQVCLWGDSWHGPYGNWVGLTDLLRYARGALRKVPQPQPQPTAPSAPSPAWHLELYREGHGFMVYAESYATEEEAKAAAARAFKSESHIRRVRVVSDGEPTEIHEVVFRPGERAMWQPHPGNL